VFSPRVRLVALALALLLAVAGLALAPPAPVRAAPVVMNCNSIGAGSLVAALAGAAAGDTITFAQDCTGAGAITLTSTLTPSVTMTIDATGRSVTISGGNSIGLFIVNSGVTLTLTSLTLANGNTTTNGGAIHNTGTLTVTGSTFTGNSAHVSGAIYNNGTLTVTNSTFSGNTATSASGAIYNGKGTVQVTGSTFSGNTATNASGAIQNGGTLTVTNSTFSGNTATSTSGAIYNGKGTVNVTGSTFSGNTATNASGAIYNNGGGTLTLTLSVVAGNTAPTGPDLFGAVSTDGGGNVIGTTADSTGLSAASDKLDVPALLGPLANNGGPTQTFALLSGSPAIDIAPCPTGLTTDQRGVPRPQGANCDSGSYEAIVSPQSFVVTSVADNVNDANCTAASCTLRQAVNLSNLTVGSGTNTITFAPAVFATAQTITLLAGSGGALTLTAPVTITAPGLNTLTVSGNNTSQIFVITGGITATISGLTATAGYTAADNGGAISVRAGGGLLTLTDSAVTNSRTADNGGGIFSDGSLIVRRVTVSAGTVRIDASTITGNQAASAGGGLGFFNNQPDVTVVNTTVDSNTAVANGGGVANLGHSLALTNVTITNNTATGAGINGGGIAFFNTGSLNDSIIAGNTSPTTPNNISGVFTGANNHVDVNTLLAPLGAYNGGSGGTTQTRPPLPGSPAIDSGNTATCAATDQRGVSRPQPTGGTCDAGAVEARVFTVSNLGGNTQSAAINTAFLAAASFTVTGTSGDPVAGGQITYTITPGTGGASATFPLAAACTLTSATIAVCPITGSGVATSPLFTANGTLGGFTIVATASGIATPTVFTETNTPGPAATFTVSGFPSPIVAGTAGTVTVTAKDAGGNIATGYTGIVHLTSSDAAAILPANATLTNGVGSFSVTLKTAGTQSIIATDTVTASITGTQTGITVTAATLTALTTTAPTGTGSGNSGSASAPSLRVGNTLTLTTLGTYTDGSHGTLTALTYTGYNPNVLSISTSGVVTALSAGATTVTITAPNSVTTTITITVSAGSGGGLMAPAPQPMAKAAGAAAIPGATPNAQPGRR